MDDWLLLIEGIILLVAHICSWGVVFHALLHKRDPRSALGWSMVALFLPVIGVLLYWLFGISRAESQAAKLMKAARDAAGTMVEMLHGGQQPGTPPGHVHGRTIPRQYQHLARVGASVTGRPLSGGNAITPLYNGDEAYPMMLEAIANAQHHVWLTTYIFNGGVIGDAFCQALGDAAQRGVDVRLVVDGLGGSIIYCRKQPWHDLPAKGVKVENFLTPSLWPPRFPLNLRNHRKVLICDATGFTGGMNIADFYSTSCAAYSAQDVHFLCSGPIVAQLQESFLLDWGFCTNVYEAPPPFVEDMCGDSFCRMLLDGLGSDRDPLHDILCGVMSGATKHIRLMTPYFLPTHELIASLKNAAFRGVQVDIILPARNNLLYVHWATFRLLPPLLKAGVRIFYQPPPFAHTKLLMIDGCYTQFGSANMDPRSLRLNFELNVETLDTSFTRELETYFDNIRKKSQVMTLETVQNFPTLIRLRNAACWVFSPYL